MTSKRTVRLAVFMIVAIIAHRAGADPGPHAVRIAGNIRPGHSTQVEMINEVVRFHHFRGDQVDVDATFTFQNSGRERERVEMFFPFCFNGNMEDDTVCRVFNVRVKMDGKRLKIRYNTEYDYYFEPVPIYEWGSQVEEVGFEADFEPGVAQILTVSYTLKKIALRKYYPFPKEKRPVVHFDYMLQTGNLWKNSIRTGTVIVDLPYTATPHRVAFSKMGESPVDDGNHPMLKDDFTVDYTDRTATLSFKDLDPVAEHDLSIWLHRPSTLKQITQLERQLNKNPDNSKIRIDLLFEYLKLFDAKKRVLNTFRPLTQSHPSWAPVSEDAADNTQFVYRPAPLQRCVQPSMPKNVDALGNAFWEYMHRKETLSPSTCIHLKTLISVIAPHRKEFPGYEQTVVNNCDYPYEVIVEACKFFEKNALTENQEDNGYRTDWHRAVTCAAYIKANRPDCPFTPFFYISEEILDCDRGIANACRYLAGVYARNERAQGEYNYCMPSPTSLRRLYAEHLASDTLDIGISLGLMRLNGIGGPIDYEGAKEALGDACGTESYGQSDACVALGEMHLEGLGVKKNHSRADSYFTRACDLNDASGCIFLSLLTSTDDREKRQLRQILNAYRKTKETSPTLIHTLERSCNAGNRWSCLSLSVLAE